MTGTTLLSAAGIGVPLSELPERDRADAEARMFALAVRSLRAGVAPPWETWARWTEAEQVVWVEAAAAIDAGEIVDPIARERHELDALQEAADAFADELAATYGGGRGEG